MAPEQASGEKHLTVGVDVHALGAILFELLTGAPPFPGKDWASVMRRVIEDPAPTVRQFRPEVSRDVEAICAKCLEKRPEDRYQSASDLADELGRFLAGDRVKARPRGLLGDIAAAVRSRRDPPSMAIWRAFVYGSANALLNGLAMGVLLFAGYPKAAFGVFVYHLFTWIAITWWFGVRRRAVLTGLERAGIALHVGMILAVVTAIPVCLTLSGPDITPLYPILNAVVGVGHFAHGTIHRGKHYLVGVLIMSQNALLAFLPVWAWPVFCAVVHCGIQFWLAVTLHRIDREGRERTLAASSP
jgi:hypothetical protein